VVPEELELLEELSF